MADPKRRDIIAGLLDQNVELARQAGDAISHLIVLAEYFGGPERDNLAYPPNVRAAINQGFEWMVNRDAFDRQAAASRSTRRTRRP